MIPVNELRIGNKILFSVTGEVITIEDGHDIQSVFFVPEDYSPIPLTPEILERAGFINGTKVIQTSLSTDEFYVDLMDKDAGFNDKRIWFSCKNLHQLQNLYFALTGEELTIKL